MIRKKLSSKSGSSLLLAIVFFLFTFFVGGTVLAAATANGSRLVAMKEGREEYNRQRSMAIVLRDQLLPGENGKTKITIVRETVDGVQRPYAQTIDNADENTVKHMFAQMVADAYRRELSSQTPDTSPKTLTLWLDGAVVAKADYLCTVEIIENTDMDMIKGEITVDVRDTDPAKPGLFRVTVPLNGSIKIDSAYRDKVLIENVSHAITFGRAQIGKRLEETGGDQA